jgi:NAD(P)-dependent dehydrogenase (short-subunit alcohol dehydrogenase family)
VARVLVTGSSQGLGLMAARRLVEDGHAVTLHARDERRAADVRDALPLHEGVVVGDVSTLAGMRAVAEQADASGSFDAVVHNVGLGYREPRREETADGLSRLWAVNVLAPYVLTALVGRAGRRPERLVYLSSGMHLGGDASLRDLQWSARRWDGVQAYSDTKLQDVLLAFGVARRWPDVHVNVVSPGWVATRMGGAGAPDDLDQAHQTQVWLAVADEPSVRTSGGFYYHRRPAELHPRARDADLQDRLLAVCHEVSGIGLG